MVARTTEFIAQLRNGDLVTAIGSAEWKSFMEMRPLLKKGDGLFFENARKAHDLVCDAVFQYIRELVTPAINERPDLDDVVEADRHRHSYVDDKDFESLPQLYKDFNAVQRALCPYMYGHIYDALKGSDLGLIPVDDDDTPNTLSRLVEDFNEIIVSLICAEDIVLTDPLWEPYRWGSNPFRLAYLSAELLKNLEQPSRFNRYSDPPILMTTHLALDLTHNELKFLPLWADGNDDGTGGVFEEALPPALYGPNGPGPAYHTGLTIPSSASDSSETASISGSMMREIAGMRLGSESVTMGPGSMDPQDSISTVYNRHAVLADDVSLRSEAFSDATSGEFMSARLAVPGPQHDWSAAEDMAMDSPYYDSDGDVFGGSQGDDETLDFDDMDDDRSSVTVDVEETVPATLSTVSAPGRHGDDRSHESDEDSDMVII